MILPKMKYPIRSWILLGHITFQIGILSPTTRIRTLLNQGTGLSNLGPTQSCTDLVPMPYLLASTGKTLDICIILLFTFYQPVLYATYDQHFPVESEEKAGYWVGFG